MRKELKAFPLRGRWRAAPDEVFELYLLNMIPLK